MNRQMLNRSNISALLAILTRRSNTSFRRIVTPVPTRFKSGWNPEPGSVLDACLKSAGMTVVVVVTSLVLPFSAHAQLANTKIAFSTYRDGNYEIYVMSTNGTNQQRLTNNSDGDDFPAWSPGGTRIVFVSFRDAGNHEIYVMNADGTNQIRLTNNAASDDAPHWSADGARIAFQSDRDGNAEIYVMNADGTNQQRLTNNSVGDAFPVWSPDGTKIVFTSNRDGNDEVYVMNADGTNQQRLTSNTASDGFPAWSPDGTKITFNSDRDGNNEIYVMNADGTNQQRLTNNTASDGFSAWSPDGTKITFNSDRDGNNEIYVMNADGTNQQNLTNNSAWDADGAWSPFFPPTISSFSPTSGPIGTTVTITGTNFNTIATNNIVHFGAVRAQVTSANLTSISVTVPVGATYQPISVTDTITGLSAYSSSSFVVTFPSSRIIDVNSLLPKVDFSTGDPFSGPWGVAVHDLDGDGKCDIAVTNEGTNAVSIFHNINSGGGITSGSFAAKVDFGTGTDPHFIAVGDLDGDGKSDIVVGNYGSNTISVFQNTSTVGSITTGSFASKVDFTTGTTPYGVAIGDLDGDGKADLVVANRNNNTVSVFRNTSSVGTITTSSFAAKVDFVTSVSPNIIAIGDIDGDAKPDIVASNGGSNAVSVLRNISTSGEITSNSFATKVDFATGVNPHGVAIGDMDNDGKLDIIVANFADTTISILRNISTPGVISTNSLATKVDFKTGISPGLICTADLDGDGKADIGVNNNNENTISMFRNTSSVGDISLTSRVDFAVGTNPNGITAGDLDGDGKPDIVVAGTGSAMISVFRNSVGPPPPVITSFSPTSGPIGTTVTITGTNFNTTASKNIVRFGAVKATVVSATSTSLNVTVPTGATYSPISVTDTASGLAVQSRLFFAVSFSSSRIIDAASFSLRVTFNTATQPLAVKIGDVDGDGKPDLLAANVISNSVSVLRNTDTSATITASSFGPSIDFTTGDGPLSLALGDIDGDGKLDLVVTCGYDQSISVMRNTSAAGTINSSSFAAKVDFPTGATPEGIAIGDLDGDGKAELVTSNRDNNTISVLRNKTSLGSITTNSFETKVEFLTPSSPFRVAIGDIDGDGKSDLVVTNSGASSVSVFRNTSTLGSITTGSFAARVDFATGANPVDVAIADLDGDGKLDLAVANSSNTLSILRNTAVSGSITTSSLAPKIDITKRSGETFSIAVGDLDGDGRPDLAVVNGDSNSVSVFKNVSTPGIMSPSSFDARLDFMTGSYAYSVDIGDLNGDGKPELVIADYFSNTVSMLRNTIPRLAPPTNLTVNAGNSQLRLGWNKNSEPDFLRYRIYSGTSSSPTNKVDSTTAGITDTVKTITGLTNGTTYYFRVTAVDSAGNESGYSNEISATPLLGQYNTDANTVLLLHMNETSGSTVSDASNYGNNGTATGTTIVDGRFGKTRSFNGLGDLIDIGSNSSLQPGNGSYTIEAWSKSSTLGYRDIFGNNWGTGNAIELRITDSGKPQFICYLNYGANGGGNVVGTKNMNDGLWHHWAGVVDASLGRIRLYVDGVLLADSSYAVANINAGTSPFAFGAVRVISPDFFWNGLIDEVRISNIARSPNEFNLQLPPVNLSATPSGTTINLSWQNGGGAVPVKVYKLYRGLDSNNVSPLYSTTSTSMPDGAVSSGVIYYYRVSAVDSTDFEGAKSYAVKAALVPTITSFSPTSGPIGTTVTITGTNFNTTASKNIVYFGAVRAQVNAASSTSLTTTTPVAATYQPISVTDSTTGLSAYSNAPFVVTFASNRMIDTSSFSPKVDFTTGTYARGVAIGDIDGDDKPDAVVTNYNSNTVSVFRNTSTSGSITSGSFAAPVDFTTGNNPYGVAIGDIDGDGKPDVVVTNYNSNTVSVFRNTSTSGSITSGSFAALVNFTTGNYPYGVAIGDLDGDGKPDLVVTNNFNSTVSVFRNTSTSGSITSGSFAARVDFTTGSSPYGVAIGDLDGDDKPDLVVANSLSYTVSVFRNTSTSGSITSGSFAARVDFTTAYYAYGVAIGDLDGDGKPDLVVTNASSNTVSIFRNTSTGGSITSGSFAAKVDFTTGSNPRGVGIGDFDGDGKPDLVLTNYLSNTASVFRNMSTGGSITSGSFADRMDFTTGAYPYGVAIGDLDGDGKPDLAVTNYVSNTFSVFRNSVAPPILGEYQPDSNTVLLLHMNETSGAAVSDASNYGNNGTATGTTIIDGRFAKARDLTGSTIQIAHNPSLSFSNQLTLEAWMKTATPTNNFVNVIHKTPQEFEISLSQGKPFFRISIDGQGFFVTGGNPVNDDKFHHVAGSYDGVGMKLYVDGSLVASVAQNGNIDNGSGLLELNGGGYVGALDEVRISNVARSPNEFNLQLPPKNLTATPSGNTISLNWQNGGGAVPLMQYKIYRGSDSTNVTLIDSSTSPMYFNIGLLSSTTYFYRVTAVDSTGFEGTKSYVASAATANVNILGEYAPDSNTKLLVHMNEASGSAVSDASSSGYTGTAVGTTIVNGRFNKARSFNGSSDVVNTTYDGNFGTNPFTVEFWVNLNSLSASHQNIIGNRMPQGPGTWWVGVYNDGRINVDGGSGQNTSSGGDITPGRWHHVAVTRDALNVLTIYKNGLRVGTGTQSGNFNGGTNVAIGAIYNGPEYINGLVDEIRISDIVRSPTEFNLQLPPKNLIASGSASVINLIWQIGGGAVPLMRYRIYRGGDSTNVSFLDSTTSVSYTNSGLASGVRYYYRVSAVDSSGFESEKSYAATAVTSRALGEYFPDANTALLMHMNEPSGSAISDAGNYSNGGTATGTSVINGRFGKARSFNGAGEFIQIPHSASLNITNVITVEAWLYDASGGSGVFAWASKYDNPLSWDIHNDAFFISRDGTENNALGYTMPKNAWTHVACVYDGQQQRVYVNGVLVSSRSWPGTIFSNTNPVYIGTHGNQYWNGYVDEVRISNFVRSPQEFNLQLPPLNLSAAASANVVSLAWQNGGGVVPLMRYKIYRGSDSTNVSLLDSTTALSYSNAAVQGGRYFYRISAVDSTGFGGTKSYAASATVARNIGEYLADANTVLLLHMNETTGLTATDVSGRNNQATATGTTILGGRFGNARKFNGSSDYIQIPHSSSLNITSAVTIEAWVKDTGSGGGYAWASKYDGPSSWDFHNDGFFVSRDGSENNPLGYNLPKNQWAHVAGVYDGQQERVYVNGVLVASRSWPGSIASNTQPVFIGTHGTQPGGTQFWPGYIDEVRISNVARSPSEFNVPLPPKSFSAVVSANTANLSWQNGGGTVPLLRYRIYRGSDSTNVSLFDSTTGTTYSEVSLALGSYYYRLTAIDSTGFESEKSYAAVAAVIGTPAIPSLAFPNDGSANHNVRPTLSWNESPNATKYHLQVSQNANFSTTIFDDTTLTGTFRQVGTLQNNRTFYWRVRANNVAGWSAFSSASSFISVPTVDVPTVSIRSSFTSPGSGPTGLAWDGRNLWMIDNLKNIYKLDTTGAVLASFTAPGLPDLDLSWDGTGLWIGGGGSSSSKHMKVDSLGNRLDSLLVGHWSFSGFEWDGKFFWISDYNSSLIYKHARNGTALLNFSVDVTFARPNTLSYDGVNLWVGSPGNFVSKYSTLGQFLYRFDLRDLGITSTASSVVAWDGQTLWFAKTDGDQFRIHRLNVPYFHTPPPIPIALSPADSVIEQPISVLLSWQSAQDASKYRLQVSLSNTFSALVYDDSTLTGTSKQVGSLTPGTTYYWRVRAKNSGGSSAFSTTRRFTTFSRLVGEYIADANTLLLLHMNEQSGSILYDASGSQNGGTAVGTTAVEGRFGSGRSFGFNESITIPGSSLTNLGTGDFSIEFWMKASGSFGNFLYKWGDEATTAGFKMFFGGGGIAGQLVMTFNDNSGSVKNAVTTRRVDDNAWHHVAAIRAANSMSLYVDGLIEMVIDITGEGSFANNNDLGFSALVGTIDEVRISNKARDPSEFNLQLPPRNISVSATATSLSLNWQNGGGVSPLLKYLIYRGGDSLNVSLMDSLTTASYQNTSLPSGTRYYYRISAIDSTRFEGGKSYAVEGITDVTKGEYKSDTATVVLLHMNEGSGQTVRDVSAKKYNGVFNSGSFPSGKFGKGFQPGDRNGIGIGDFTTSGLEEKMTLETWVKLDAVPPSWPLMYYQNIRFHVQSDLSVIMGLTLSNGTNIGIGSRPNAVRIGQWFHLAGTFENRTAKLYLNGLLIDSRTYSQPISNVGQGASIAQSDVSQPFPGVVDEIRISNVARQPSEFNLQLPPTNIVAIPSAGTISLSWQNGGGGTGLLRYMIYRGGDSTNVSLIDSSTSPSYSDIGLASGTRYYYRVSTVDSLAFEAAKSYAVSSVTSPSYGEYTADSSTVLIAHMNEPVGAKVSDASSYVNNGTATGTTIVNGRFGKGRKYTTSAEYLTVLHANSLNFGTGDFTLESWVNTLGVADPGGHIFHKRGTGGLGWYTNVEVNVGRVSITLYTVPSGQATFSIRSSRSIADGNWHHLAYVKSGLNLRIFIDGALDASGALLTAASADNDGILNIGLVSGGAGGDMFKGVLDEVRISNIARLPGEFDLQLPPRNLIATALGGTVNLSWQNSGGGIPLMKYKIYRGTDSTNVTVLDSTTGSTYSNTGLSANSTFYYRVGAIDSTGFRSAMSYADSARTASDVTAPTSPVNPSISPSGWTSAAVDTIRWTNPSDASGITKGWYSLNTAPTVNAPGTSLPVSGSSFTLNNTTLGQTRIYLYLEDGMGNKDPTSAVSVVAKYDNVPPVVRDDSVNVATFNTNAPAAVSISALAASDANSGIKSFQLQYKRSGTPWSTATSVAMPGSISSAFLTNNARFGVDYRISLTDSANNQSVTPTRSVPIRFGAQLTRTDTSGIPVPQYSVASLPSGAPQEYAYRMFSVPLDLDDKTPKSIFETNTGLGAYDTKAWRFYQLTVNDNYDEYTSFSTQSVVTPGKAFLLVLRTGTTVKTGSGKVLKTDSLNVNGISLKSGYNFVGNPFNFDIRTDSLSVTNTSALSGGTLNNNWWEFVGLGGTNGGWKPNPTILKAWEGIVIKTIAATTLKFNIADRPGSAPPSGEDFSRNIAHAGPTQSWQMRINAQRLDNGVVDVENVIGADQRASDAADRFDMTEPPMVGQRSLSLSFTSPVGSLTHDFRAPNDEGYVWDFMVRSTDENAKIVLTFEGVDAVGQLVHVIDLDTRMPWKLNKGSRIDVNTAECERSFRLIVGSLEFAQRHSNGIDLVPREFSLYQNYPNPFNPGTVIRYSLPLNSVSYAVSLKVYNLLGQEVANLVEAQQVPGFYEIELDGRTLSSGPYFYRIVATGESRETTYSGVKRMMLLK